MAKKKAAKKMPAKAWKRRPRTVASGFIQTSLDPKSMKRIQALAAANEQTVAGFVRDILVLCASGTGVLRRVDNGPKAKRATKKRPK